MISLRAITNVNGNKYEDIDDFEYLLNRNSVKEKLQRIVQKRMSMATGRWNHQSLLENWESEGNRGSAIVPKNWSIWSEWGILSEMPQKRVKNYVRKLFNEKDYIPKDFEFM